MPSKKQQTYSEAEYIFETRHCNSIEMLEDEKFDLEKKSDMGIKADVKRFNMEEEKYYKKENPPIPHVDWKLPARCDMDFHKWNIGQMAEWVFSVTGSDKSRNIVRAQEMDGASMLVFLENNETRDDLKFGFWPWRKLAVAAKIMIEYYNSNLN